eukprot:12308890-Alexandrium_andersonii.AAC.1
MNIRRVGNTKQGRTPDARGIPETTAGHMADMQKPPTTTILRLPSCPPLRLASAAPMRTRGPCAPQI